MTAREDEARVPSASLFYRGARALARTVGLLPPPPAGPPPISTSILDVYVNAPPSAANALDIFKGEWASRLPPPLADAAAGQVELFNDGRLAWAFEAFGGIRGKRILELGPLEGGHSYMCDRAGAADVIAIEANTRAYLRCLIAKELLGMPAVRFLCGDFLEYLRGSPAPVDVCVASGVLYHMANPAELIALISRMADRVYLWTHYYEDALIAANDRTAHRRVSPVAAEFEGFAHRLYRHEYGVSLKAQGFCGAGAPSSAWMSREDVLACLRHFGYTNIAIGFDDPNHMNGPAFSLAARK